MGAQWLFGLVIGALLTWNAGCVDDSSDDNDNFPPPGTGGATVTGGVATTGGTPGVTGGVVNGSGGVTPVTGGVVNGTGGATPVTGGVVNGTGGTTPVTGGTTPVTGGAMPATGGDMGATGGTTGGPMPELVANTWTENCLSYQPAMNGQCSSHYCGVNQETLAQALDPVGECSNMPEFICNRIGDLVTAVSQCGVEVATPMILDLDPDAVRDGTSECVRRDSQWGVVPDLCLDCFSQVAACTAADFDCAVTCLAGDSADCDSCRLALGCDQMIFPCTGLPDPGLP